MSLEDIRYKRNSFQRRVHDGLAKNKRITAIFAGWRTGKTDYVSLEHVIRRQVYGNPDVLHLIAANTYSQLLDSTLRTLYKWLKRLDIPCMPAELPKVARPFSLYIWNGEKWVEFLCRSMENFDIIAGTTLGSGWLDEVWGTESWTYNLANSRLSDKESKYLQLVLTTTKDEPDHWMYTDIVEPYSRNEILDDGLRAHDLIEIIEGKTEENRSNLVDGYVALQRATLEKRLYERFIENQWITTQTGRAYPYFAPDNIRDVAFTPNFPLLVVCDFNIDPCIWGIGQNRKGFTHALDEISLRNTDLRKMCAETQLRIINLWKGFGLDDGEATRKAKGHRTIFYGDYTSAHRRDVSATESSWSIIKDQFRGWNCEYRLRSNPRIVDRVNAFNSRLQSAAGVSYFSLSSKCLELKKDLEIVSMDDLRKNKNECGDRTHASDGWGYEEWYEHPLEKRVGILSE